MDTRFWLGTMAALGLALLTCCAPSPRVLRSYVGAQRALAEGAAAEHQKLCTPPSSPAATIPEPPPPGPPPARCAELQSCLEGTQAVARQCKAAIDVAGQRTYRQEALSCQGEHLIALGRCKAAGVQARAKGGTP